MNENDNFALVPKSPSALEKAQPGARRILSGMVADTLALVKQGRLPIFRVLLGLGAKQDKDYYELFEKQIEAMLGDQFDTRFLRFDRATELLRLAEGQIFGLVVVSLTETKWDTISDKPYEWGWCYDTRKQDIVELLGTLKSRLRIPIITPTGLDNQTSEGLNTERLKRSGVHAFGTYAVPFSTQAFWETLRTCLPVRSDVEKKDGSTVPRLRRIRPPRIIIMDDEEGPRRSIHFVISRIFDKDATVLLFDDVEEALRELEREPPDLFITDYCHPKMFGSAELRFLRERKVRYPVFVISAGAHNDLVLRNAGPDLNVTFFPKPWDPSEIRRELEKYFDPSDHPDPKVPKHEA